MKVVGWKCVIRDAAHGKGEQGGPLCVPHSDSMWMQDVCLVCLPDVQQ